MDISVITPIYKGNRFIPHILEMLCRNAKNAKGLSLELVLVNDYPNEELMVDETKVDGFVLKMIINESNLGIHAARINGIKHAVGQYLMMLDQDDEIESDALVKMYAAAKGNKAVLCNGYAEDSNGIRTSLFNNKNICHVNNLKYYFYLGNVVASPGLVMIRNECIPTGWMENVMKTNGADDWLLWVLYLADGNSFEILNKFFYIHKNDGTNTSDNLEKMLHSSEEGFMILSRTGKVKKKYLNIYQRRLLMRNKYSLANGRLDKVMQYILNPDIAYYVFKHKNRT